MAVLGGLKPLRLSSSGSGRAGAPEEDGSGVHARGSLAEEVSMVLCLQCCLTLLDAFTVLPC